MTRLPLPSVAIDSIRFSFPPCPAGTAGVERLPHPEACFFYVMGVLSRGPRRICLDPVATTVSVDERYGQLLRSLPAPHRGTGLRIVHHPGRQALLLRRLSRDLPHVERGRHPRSSGAVHAELTVAFRRPAPHCCSGRLSSRVPRRFRPLNSKTKRLKWHMYMGRPVPPRPRWITP